MSDTEKLQEEYALCLRLEVLAEAVLAGNFDLATDFQRLSFAFASKSAKSYQAVLRLIEHGLGEPALILIRTIFDDLINLTYINTEPDGLTKLFVEFQLVEKKRYIDSWEEAHLGKRELKELKVQWEAVHKDQYERVQSNYPKKTYWSGKTVREMAALVDPDLAKTYLILYAYASGFAHGGSPSALLSYVGQNDDMTLTSLAAPSEAEIAEVLIAGFSLFSRLLKLFAAACGSDQTELEALTAEGDKVFNERPASRADRA